MTPFTMTPGHLDYFRRRLLAWRDQLLQELTQATQKPSEADAFLQKTNPPRLELVINTTTIDKTTRNAIKTDQSNPSPSISG